MFRGLLLRTFMRRMSLLAGRGALDRAVRRLPRLRGEHRRGALTLAFSVGVLGLVNCYLVRITGRLTPGIMVHASFNALALVVALATGS